MNPILLLEINEIPWRVLDRYGRSGEFPSIRQFLAGAYQFTTLAVDTGELSPWVTWPTLHRGMNNESHRIKNLGQDPSTFHGKPIWQEIRERGGTIGVCGSMQSWPPMEPGEGGFYIPDTFAHDERCFPAYLSQLQAFNLNQVRKNPRVVNSTVPGLREATGVCSALVRSGVRLRTLGRLAKQMMKERMDSSTVLRRPIFQTILFWDVFRAHFNEQNPPHFSTFFTNHVAGVMHRYWRDVFPEDFGEQPAPKSKEWLMRFALQVLDEMLADALKWATANPKLVVVFASSMGQAAVHRGYHEGVELVVEDLGLLMACAGMARSDYTPLLAMAPQVAVDIPDISKAARVRRILEEAYCGDRRQFISAQPIGSSLSITVGTPPLKEMAGETFRINGAQVRWADAGIRKQSIEPGTAYHVPEGSLAVYSAPAMNQSPDQSRRTVRADKVKDWLLSIHESGAPAISTLPVT